MTMVEFWDRLKAALARRVRWVWNWCNEYLIRLGAYSPVFASFYYALFNRSFDREHRAVLAGRLEHDESQSGDRAQTLSILRRGIHRLEKGILSKPRRDIFAVGYIQETVDFYEYAVQSRENGAIVSEEELRWAHDVLEKYFAITGSHPQIDAQRERFEQLPSPGSGTNGQPKRPYERDLSVPPSVDYDDLLELSKRRRSVRWFRQEPVPRELIRKAVDVASMSPSACNRQPFEFRVFDDPELVDEIASLPAGTKGFHQNFPAIVVLVGELRNYYGERDRHLIYIDTSLAAMGFVYAAETLGLSTCCINWPDIEEHEQEADEVLGLKADQRPVMFMAVGYPDPDGMVAYSQKKPNREICNFNQT
jgi:nitroreductase